MTQSTAPQKVAILGGGMGALSTALQMTSLPEWQKRFDITVYQLGWRLGGKCASSRGADERIEEHGIHGFMGSYFNALPMMSEVYEELDRKPGMPLATFEEAFIPSDFTMSWEYRDGGLIPWPARLPPNDIPPTDGSYYKGVPTAIAAIIEEILKTLEATAELPGFIEAGLQHVVSRAKASLEIPLSEGPDHPLVGELTGIRGLVSGAARLVDTLAPKLADKQTDLRRALLTLDFYATVIIGALTDNVQVLGYDYLDNENWSDWLTRHGIAPETLASPIPLSTVNICYQSPDGDTSRAAVMGAGCYLDWTLRGAAYMGSLIWSFAAGTGETVVAPVYELLKRRGVKFEFFHKVENLVLSHDKTSIQEIEFTVQATLKHPERGYQPLIDVKGLPSWPRRPLYDQLNEGEYLRILDIDLESYWCGWPTAEFPYLREKKVLSKGHGFDQIVFGISVGAIPYLCKELVDHSPAWKGMVDNIPALTTQAMQIWLSKDMYEMGWAEPLVGDELAISGTYFCPPNGNGNFPGLLKWENWPADNQPRAIWYFCGLMADYEPPPPFTDTDYPRRAAERVKAQSIQYLQTTIGTMLPKATVRAANGLGDPMGLDFGLLVDTQNPNAQGVQRFDSQFWRANIDPTERYVASPPGSIDYRLEAWGSGYDNLVLAGDWIYTGLNVGSFEGAAMSGMLASHALTAYPPLKDIIGYPTVPRPQLSADRPHTPPPSFETDVPAVRLVG